MSVNFKTGIVSITFRQFAYKNIINVASTANLSNIEWGSDIHVPYDDNEKAQTVLYEMEAKKMTSVSYASYYKLGQKQYDIFEKILFTARILNVANIKVWGGVKNRNLMNEYDIRDIIEDLYHVSKKAKEYNINISIEPHYNSIIDTMDNAVWFMNLYNEINPKNDNVFIYWQPDYNLTHEENLSDLKLVCPFLSNVHVYAKDKSNRYSLEAKAREWLDYVRTAKENDNGNFHYFLLEFIKNDSPEQFAEDAMILNKMIEMA